MLNLIELALKNYKNGTDIEKLFTQKKELEYQLKNLEFFVSLFLID